MKTLLTAISAPAAASGHYLMATNPSVRFLSGQGKLEVSGASAEDKITIFVK